MPDRVRVNREVTTTTQSAVGAPDSEAPPTLELWFEFGSNYSYLTVMRVEELARMLGGAEVSDRFRRAARELLERGHQ